MNSVQVTIMFLKFFCLYIFVEHLSIGVIRTVIFIYVFLLGYHTCFNESRVGPFAITRRYKILDCFNKIKGSIFSSIHEQVLFEVYGSQKFGSFG